MRKCYQELNASHVRQIYQITCFGYFKNKREKKYITKIEKKTNGIEVEGRSTDQPDQQIGSSRQMTSEHDFIERFAAMNNGLP